MRRGLVTSPDLTWEPSTASYRLNTELWTPSFSLLSFSISIWLLDSSSWSTSPASSSRASACALTGETWHMSIQGIMSLLSFWEYLYAICNCFSSTSDGIRNQFRIVLKLFIIMGIPWICDFLSTWVEFNLGGFDNSFAIRLCLDIINLTTVTFLINLTVCHHDAVSRACWYSSSWWGCDPWWRAYRRAAPGLGPGWATPRAPPSPPSPSRELTSQYGLCRLIYTRTTTSLLRCLLLVLTLYCPGWGYLNQCHCPGWR